MECYKKLTVCQKKERDREKKTHFHCRYEIIYGPIIIEI